MRSRIRKAGARLGLFCIVLACVLTVGAWASSKLDSQLPPAPREFRFARLAYSDNSMLGFGGFRRGREGSWLTDAPEAEQHVLAGIRRLTRIDAIDPESESFVSVRPGDAELFEYPFLYGVEVGRWYLSDEEAANLREYLLRGGFMMVDDFHGSAQWESFMESLRRVFPEREVIDLPADHEIFHVLYDLDQKQQIPGVFALMSGRTYEQDGVDPHWRGVLDDSGRVMIIINHNMDLGDAWEHADTPEYPHELTTLAYRFAINYAMYALSH
jgi:Domain of unknown function (DUF4159)